MKLLLCLFAMIGLAVTPLSAITFTYSGTVETVTDGSTWSLSGLEVGATFQANLQIDEALLGEDLYPYYLASGVYPIGLEFSVAGHIITLIPFYVVSASVNSAHDFGIGGEGGGPGAFWGMWGQGGSEGALFGAGAGPYGGPAFTASATLSSTNVPDSASSGLLLAAATLSLLVFKWRTETAARASESSTSKF